MLHRNWAPAPTWVSLLGLLMIAGCAPNPGAPAGSSSQAPPLGPGMARVWVLRQADPPQGNIEGARPMLFANGAPIAESREGTAFFRDFPPGTYKLTVQAFGTPAKQSDTVQLSAGMQSYVQVQAVPNWEEGSPVGGWSFAVLTMSPEIAQ